MQVLMFAQSSSIKDMVLMPNSIAKDSLIGNISHSLCFEVNNDQIDNLVIELERALVRYLGATGKVQTKKNLFIIDGKIEKNPVNLKKKYVNMKNTKTVFIHF